MVFMESDVMISWFGILLNSSASALSIPGRYRISKLKLARSAINLWLVASSFADVNS